MTKHYIFKSIIRPAACGCVSLLLFSCDSSEQHSAAQPSAEPQAAPKVTAPTSVEDVDRMLVGTWTYTGQEYTMMDHTLWEKWVFKPDGTMEEYSATAQDDGWKQPKTKTWKSVTEKYANTGHRWYGINVGGWARPIIVKDSGTLRFHPSDDVDVEFTKGDKFPFSK